MTTITFYKGLKTIGGTLVAIETEHARCLFDFGYEVNEKYDGKVKKREGKMVSDLIQLGMLPEVSGIYEKEELHKHLLEPFHLDGKKTIFLISHMHIDHMGGLGMLAKEIPVYMSQESLILYEHLIAMGDFDYKKHKKCVGLAFEDILTEGDITVQVLSIDHDVIGASGFLITTPDGTIAYTGDYRMHGFHPENTLQFACKVKGVDLLITEGVTVSFHDIDMLSLQEPKDVRTEYTLLDEMTQLAKDHEGLVIINPYNRNVERIHQLQERLKECGRTLVLDTIQADYVSAFYKEETYYVYEDTFQLEMFDSSWKVVTKEDILKNPRKYVLQLDYQNMYEIFDLLPTNCYYVHMDGAPLGAYDPSFDKMLALLDSVRIPYEHKSIGGHASPYELRKIIDTIVPNVLIPLHSFRPEQVKSNSAKEIILPKIGEKFLFVDHKIIKQRL